MIIAVDGPAAAGKGTIARALASHFGYHFLDTGSLYRMVGLAVLRAGQDSAAPAAATAAAKTLDPKNYSAEELRSETVGDAASQVAVIPEVRAALLDLQRAFARKPPGAVLDGRDIGTIVCPDAEIKIFVTASPEVRAKRRQLELGSASYEQVLAEIKARDRRDSTRATAPLAAAPDAMVLDSSRLTINEAIEAAVRLAAGKAGFRLSPG